jgi:hypothetical protein
LVTIRLREDLGQAREHHALTANNESLNSKCQAIENVKERRPRGRTISVGTIMFRSRHALKTIHFEGELLPDWAQLLDLAATLSSVSEETRDWFSRFTHMTGVDDARTVTAHCELLRASLREHRDAVVAELRHGPDDSDAPKVFAAWVYTLDTMIQHASLIQTCRWHVEGTEGMVPGDFGDGDVTLRRI